MICLCQWLSWLSTSRARKMHVRARRATAILQAQFAIAMRIARWIPAAEERRETRALHWPRSWPRWSSAASPSRHVSRGRYRRSENLHLRLTRVASSLLYPGHSSPLLSERQRKRKRSRRNRERKRLAEQVTGGGYLRLWFSADSRENRENEHRERRGRDGEGCKSRRKTNRNDRPIYTRSRSDSAGEDVLWNLARIFSQKLILRLESFVGLD